MKYIETFRDGEKVGDIYLCKSKTSAVTKNGKPYDSVILQDKTGTIDAKIWDPNSLGIDDFDALDYVDVVGDVITFNGGLQLNIKRARKVAEGEYDPKEYLPVSGKDLDQMYNDLLGYIASVSNPYLKKLLEMFFVQILSQNLKSIRLQKVSITDLSADYWSIPFLLQNYVIIMQQITNVLTETC